MSSTSSQSNTLDAATIQVAEMLSAAAYDSLSGLSSDTNIQQLEAQGWNPVPTLPQQTDSTDSYQGIAFYKTINGVVQVIIANRGTSPTRVGDLTMDYDISHNIQPPSDSSAQAYYNAILNYFTIQQGITNINVIETGHSLGGQEADFVATRTGLLAPTEAITFDAPGIGPAAQTASSADAVNISNFNDVIHLAGGTYVGNETTVSAPASTLIDSAVGQALGAPLGGIGMLMGGILGNVTANHAINDIASYLSADPALAGVDLSVYSAGQINQAVVNALAAMTPSQYYAMTSAQRAIFLAGVFSQYGSAGSSSGSVSTTDIQEAFTVVSSSPGAQTLTGAVGDSITLSSSGDTLTSTASNGYTDTENFDITTGALISDTWKNAIGTNGTDTYAADGSSSSTVTYADGNYATTLDDGQGNITTDYYTKDGVEIRSTWVHSDGTSGSVNQYADGLTLMPGGGPNSIPTTASSVVQNPDGSYTTVDWNAQNQSVTANFAANGSQTSQSTGTGTGANDLTVASSSTAVVANLNGGYESFTTNHNAAGQDIGNTWYASYSDGTVDPNGDMITLATGAEATGTSWGWQGTTALSGSMTFDASGVQTLDIKALDGTSWVVTNEQQGSTVSHKSSSGVLLSDQWAIADGPGVISGVPTSASVTGTDSFNADGSGSGTFTDLRDGTSGTVTLNGQGDIVVVNTNASGTVTSEDTWNASTDSYTIATLNGSGTTLNSYDYLANGNVIATDYAPDGTTIADQQTVAAGLVVNPDGSSFSKVVNADGSYTVYYMNASGDTTVYQYSASGQLTGTEHTSSYDWAIANASGTLSNGQSWTSPYNAATPTYTDSNGTTWTLYLNAASKTTGFDYVNQTAGTHGYGTYGSDGSLQEVEYAQNGTYEEIVQNSQGVVTDTTYFDASGNETGDAWTAPDGSHGGDTYNADGSSSGTSINADGSYGSYTDDGKGDMVSAEYSAAGVMLSEVWTNADGTSGNETFNADGSTVATSYNADGSYYTTNNDGKGDITQTNYTSAGVETSDAWQKANGTTGSDTFFAPGSAYNLLAEGQTTNSDGSSSQYQTIVNSNNLVETDTTYYASGGVVSGRSVETSDNAGDTTTDTYAADGMLSGVSWSVNNQYVTTTATATGSSSYNSNDQSDLIISINSDGSYTQLLSDGKGDYTTEYFTAANVLTSDTWKTFTGASGSDTYNADGSYSHSTNDGQGDTTTDNYSTTGLLISDAWTKSNGSYGSDTYNANGSSSSTVYASDGSHTVTLNDGSANVTTECFGINGALSNITWSINNPDLTTTSTNTNGTTTTTSQNTVDGSSMITVTNPDGSTSVTLNDGRGDITTTNDSAAGVLTGDTWQLANGATGSDTVNADGSSSNTVNDGQGDSMTKAYSSSGTLVSDSWVNADGSHGGDIFNPDGSGTTTIYATDGSSTITTNDGQGGRITKQYSSSGVLLDDTWVNPASGTLGMDTYNTDGSVATTTAYTINNVTANPFMTGPASDYQIKYHKGASGNILADSWTSSSGTYGYDSYSYYTYWSGQTQEVGLGAINAVEYLQDGSYEETTYAANPNMDGVGQNGIYIGHYSASGTLLSDVYLNPQAGITGYGSDIYHSDGSSSGYSENSIDSIQYRTGANGGYNANIFSGLGSPVATLAELPSGSGHFSADGGLLSWTAGDAFSGSVPYAQHGMISSTEPYVYYNPSAGVTVAAYMLSSGASVNLGQANSGYFNDSLNIPNPFQLNAPYLLSQSSAVKTIATDGTYRDVLSNDYVSITDNYTAAGVLVSDSWSIANVYGNPYAGTSGTDQYNADGSFSGTTVNADGSYTTSSTTATGNTSTDTYTATGVLTGDTWTDANGTSGADTYSGTGVLTQSTWTNADGSTGSNLYNSAGTLTETTWTSTDGSSGSTTYNADGSTSASSNDGKGDVYTDNYNAAGALTSDAWLLANGNAGTDTYSGGVRIADTWLNASAGTSGNDTYNAAGALLFSSWTNPDGSVGSNSYDGNGTLTMTTATDPTGAETIQTPTGTDAITLGPLSTTLTNSGATDTVALGAAVNPDQLWFTQSGTDLVVSVLGSTENLTVKDWFNGLANQVSAFVAGNGQTLAGSNVEQLVQAMASFSPPTSSQTAYTTAEATNLDPVIAATWQ